MTDIATYIFYLTLLAFLVISTKLLSRKKIKGETTYDPHRLNALYFILIIVISFVVGFRFEVGTDWFMYSGHLSDIINHSLNINEQRFEPGLYFIAKFTEFIGGDYRIVLFLSAILTWYFFFKSVPKYILPLFIFFIFVEEYFFWGMNGVRQFIAISIWLYSIRFITSKDFKKFTITILFASLFHTSAILLFPLYYLPYDKLFNKFVWLGLYISSFLFMYFIDLSVLYSSLDFFILYLVQNINLFDSYEIYLERDQLFAGEKNIGLGVVFKGVINIVIIFFGERLISNFRNIKPFIIIFLLGALFSNLFFGSQLFGRLLTYFIMIRSVVLSFLIYYLWKNRGLRLLSVFIVVLYIILFLYTIYSNSNMCCPYNINIF